LYFAALLPQFIDPTQAVLPQFVVFGLLTLALDLLIYGAYGALGHVSGYRGLKP
jgi:homoserine/homoserine lactone efflux protein